MRMCPIIRMLLDSSTKYWTVSTDWTPAWIAVREEPYIPRNEMNVSAAPQENLEQDLQLADDAPELVWRCDLGRRPELE